MAGCRVASFLVFQEGDGFGLIFGAETGLFASRRFLAVENTRCRNR